MSYGVGGGATKEGWGGEISGGRRKGCKWVG